MPYQDPNTLTPEEKLARQEELAELSFERLSLEESLLPPEADYEVILVDALAGNDQVYVGPTVQRTVWIDAGDGDDLVRISSGNTILVDQAPSWSPATTSQSTLIESAIRRGLAKASRSKGSRWTIPRTSTGTASHWPPTPRPTPRSWPPALGPGRVDLGIVSGQWRRQHHRRGHVCDLGLRGRHRRRRRQRHPRDGLSLRRMSRPFRMSSACAG